MLKQSFSRQTYIEAGLDEVWRFFSDPYNLPEITPPDMRFKILSESLPHSIAEAMRIRYRVCPVRHIPVTWESEITSVEPGHYFTDKQTRGPYALWEHTHVFELQNDGVLMTDHVVYKLPGGIAGLHMMGGFVERRLASIFDYRERRISSIFKTADHVHHH